MLQPYTMLHHFQVEINFDDEMVGATAATAADWPALTSTLNDPVDQVLKHLNP